MVLFILINEQLPQCSIIVDRLQGGPHVFVLINEQPRILTSGQYYCRQLTGGTPVFVQRWSPSGTTYDKGGPTMHTQVVLRGPSMHRRRWSTGPSMCT